jgi:hypothetical protein
MNVDPDDDDHDDHNDAAIITPAQSKEYEEAALEKLWNGAWTEPEWTALAAMEGVSSSCFRCFCGFADINASLSHTHNLYLSRLRIRRFRWEMALDATMLRLVLTRR